MDKKTSRRPDISDREILELHKKGLNYRQIAKYFKTDSKVIIARLVRNGVQIIKLSKETRQDLDNNIILQLYKEGKSTSAIAELLKTNDVTIGNRLKSQGITFESNYRDDIKTEEIIKLYVDEKLSTRKIAKRFNTTAQLIKTRLEKAGIARRTRLEAGDLIARRNICVVCGKIFRPKKYWKDTNGRDRKTCSDACYSILTSEIHSGEKAENWKGGGSQEYYQKRLREEYELVCEICQTETARIDTHHEDGDHKNNTKENIHPWCVVCHARYHYITEGNRLKNWNPNTPKLIEFKKRLNELGISYNIKTI
jgi:hypothetical protein